MKNCSCRVAWTLIALGLTALQTIAQSIYGPYTFTTLAGNADYGSTDGTGSAARFNYPRGVAVDSAGTLYAADTGNNTIRKGIRTSSVPAPIVQPPSLSAGQFGFGISGFPCLVVNIESSSDLS